MVENKAAVAASVCFFVIVVCWIVWPKLFAGIADRKKAAIDASIYILPGRVPPANDPADRSLWIGDWYIKDFMPRWDPERQFLYFSHIPRTAGGTFSTLLNTLFPPRYTHPSSSYAKAITGGWHNFLNATPEQWVTWKVLYTHEDFSLIKYIPREVAPLVFLRNPAKQRRSLYDVPVQKKFQRGYPHVTDWIGSPDYPLYYQVEWVAGILSWWPYSKASESYIRGHIRDRRQMLKRAITNLGTTTWFGLTDRLNESLCLFYYTHQLRPKVIGDDYSYIHRVKDQKRSDGDYEDLQKPLLGMEYTFLEIAEILFNKRMQWMKDDYLINARKMQKYIAGECTGYLPEVDLDTLEGPDDESDESYETEDSTDVERGDPARRKTKVIKPRRRRGRKPGGRHPLSADD